MLKAPKQHTIPTCSAHMHTRALHGDTLSDPYHWLRDPSYPEVKDEQIRAYLEEENTYYDSVMSEKADLSEALFAELKGRVKEDEESVPWQQGQYEYRWAYTPGAQYRTWYYRDRSDDPFAKEGWLVLLDENKEAADHEFFRLGSLDVSPDGKLLAFSADTNGSERFTMYVRDLETGEEVTKPLKETSGEIVWYNNSKAYATVMVSKEWRPYRVVQRQLKNTSEQLLFEEMDTSFFVHIGATTSHKYLVVRSADHVTAEAHLLPLDKISDRKPVCMLKRRTGHDYYVDHGGKDFYVRSNRDHKNFSIFRAFEKEPDVPWRVVLAGNERRYIHGMQAFENLVAVEDRLDGQDQIYLIRPDNSGYVEMPEHVFEVSIGHNAEVDQKFLRLNFTSLITPPTVYDYNLETGEMVTRKQQEIPSGYDKEEYRAERIFIEARDGTGVPVSLVYHKDWKKGTDAPLHLYGYGAYGLGMSPAFSSARLSLLDRGFAYAIAHIRGGDELGYAWYEAGKLMDRTNTFHDFVDVATALVERRYVKAGNVTISGGSAGGSLMGAALNETPALFAGSVLHVPFVDVLNTMLDDSLPLTPIEWPEWGNPIKSKEAYDYIKSYCPYTNIEAKDYPPMMVTGGLNDPRVTYWEPAKWTAKMRSTKTDDNLLVMKINMGAGHGGKSGRYERLHEVAEEYTFLLMCTGKA